MKWPRSVSFFADDARLDGAPKGIDKPRRWPVSCSFCHIGEQLEIGQQSDGVELPRNGGDDGK